MLALTGDEEEAQTITVFGPEKLRSITWNGEKVPIKSRDGPVYVASIKGPSTVKLPSLGPWAWADSLPEIANDYKPTSDGWVGKC